MKQGAALTVTDALGLGAEQVVAVMRAVGVGDHVAYGIRVPRVAQCIQHRDAVVTLHTGLYQY